MKFFPLGACVGVAAPLSANMGLPHISETRGRAGATARPGGLKMQCLTIATFSIFILVANVNLVAVVVLVDENMSFLF